MTTLSPRSIAELTDEPSTPVVPPLVHAPAPESPPAPKKKRSVAKILLPLLSAIAIGVGAITWSMGRGKEATDDAFIEGHVANVNPRVAGQVKTVLVKDNQVVHAGDVLVELDDRDHRVRIDAAKADLAAANASLGAAQAQLAVTTKSAEANVTVAKGGVTQARALEGSTFASIEQARADVVAATSRRDLAQLERDRSAKLVGDGAIARADLDLKTSNLDQAEAALAQAKARLVAAQSNVGNSTGTVEGAKGRLALAELGPEQIELANAQVALAAAHVEQSKAALEQAELNLSYTKVVAQTDGTVARRSVEVGMTVSPDRPLMAIVPLDDTWIVANFKEDQIAEMRPGQRVKIEVDGYGGRELEGVVDSLAAGTGSRFSLLPPDNASGNFTKVVQRVPVLVHIDEAHRGDAILRPGMSVSVTVVTK